MPRFPGRESNRGTPDGPAAGYRHLGIGERMRHRLPVCPWNRAPRPGLAARPCDSMTSVPEKSTIAAWKRQSLPAAAVPLGLAIALSVLLTPNPGSADGHACLADEPPTYRTSEFRAVVPCSLDGATVVTTGTLQILLDHGDPLLIDVFPAPRAPRIVRDSEDHLWLPPVRDSLPGTVWLPNVGLGVLPVEEENYFRANLERFTGGDRTRTIVFFCLSDCWMSWNAARRALDWNYTSIVWYPEGTDGWEAAGLELTEVSPVERTEGQ